MEGLVGGALIYHCPAFISFDIKRSLLSSVSVLAYFTFLDSPAQHFYLTLIFTLAMYSLFA